MHKINILAHCPTQNIFELHKSFSFQRALMKTEGISKHFDSCTKLVVIPILSASWHAQIGLACVITLDPSLLGSENPSQTIGATQIDHQRNANRSSAQRKSNIAAATHFDAKLFPLCIYLFFLRELLCSNIFYLIMGCCIRCFINCKSNRRTNKNIRSIIGKFVQNQNHSYHHKSKNKTSHTLFISNQCWIVV